MWKTVALLQGRRSSSMLRSRHVGLLVAVLVCIVRVDEEKVY